MKVIYGIGISVTLGFGFVWLVCKLVTRLFRKANRPKTEPFFRGAQITGAAAKKVFMHLINGWRNNNKVVRILIIQNPHQTVENPCFALCKAGIFDSLRQAGTLDFNPFSDLKKDKWYYTTVLEATVMHNYYLDDKKVEIKWEDCK